jgi:hypothetical protein
MNIQYQVSYFILNKNKMKEIYDFVEKENIESFYTVAFGILPSISLDEIRVSNVQPELHILLNSHISSYRIDMKTMKKRFPDIPIFFEHYDPKLFIEL